MNHRTKVYFDHLSASAAAAIAVTRHPFADAQPNACHANCEAFIHRFAGYELVRGWLLFGGCWFVPHSVVRATASGQLTDITPNPTGSGAIPFVEHRGSDKDFAVLRQGRDGGWLYPQLDHLAMG